MHNEILLERAKIAASSRISRQLLHDMEVQTVWDMVSNDMLAQIATTVYRHKVDRQEIEVPFERERTVSVVSTAKFISHFGALATILFLGALAGLIFGATSTAVLCFFVGLSVTFGLVSIVRRPEEITVRAAGTVKVAANYWNTFPDNARVYPRELGSPVRIIEYQPPSVEYRED